MAMLKRVFRTGCVLIVILAPGMGAFVFADSPAGNRAIVPELWVPNYDESKIPPHTLPDPLVTQLGEPVTSPDQWVARHAELVRQFENHVFGRMPSQRRIRTEIVRTDPTWNDAKTIRHELTVTLLPLGESELGKNALPLHVLVDVPVGASAEKPFPAFIGLNFQGNHTVTNDPLVRLPESWIAEGRNGTTDGNVAAETGRGVARSRWPAEMINDRGFALVTAYYGDIDPDFDDGFENGVHGLLADWIGRQPAGQRPGSIAGWAYGLQAILDAIEQTPHLGIDPRNVGVIGHSRLGKTSLWAGAIDHRFRIIVSNNSGCGGAALSRRAIGETVGRINRSFPHWFCDRFNDYNENENALPIDSHELIAMSAPRPVAIGSATDDPWADPKGEFLAAVHASPVYELYGVPGLIDRGKTADVMPAPNEAFVKGTIAYHLRDGKHDLTKDDWIRYLDVFDRHRLNSLGPAGPVPASAPAASVNRSTAQP